MKRITWVCCVIVLLWGLCMPAAAAQPLTVALYEEPPYQFLNDNGQADGLLVELFDEVSARTDFRVEYVSYPSLRECVEALKNGEADAVLGMPSAATYELSETAELYAAPLVIAENTQFAERQRQGKKVYCTAGYSYNVTGREIIYSLGADRYIISDRTRELIELIASGKLDVAILDKGVLDYAASEGSPSLNLTVTNAYLDTVKYTVACDTKDSALLRALNTAILDLRIGGNYTEIKQRWIVEDVETDWRKILIYFATGAGVLLAVFGGYLIINYRIQRMLEGELQEKTQGLRESNARLEDRVRQLQFEGNLRRKLIKNARNGMVMVDREGNIQLMNQSANRMAGFPERTYGTPIMELPCFREVLAQVGDRMFTQGFSADNLQVTVQQKEGIPPTVFRLNIQQIIESGRLTGALITLEDITVEQRMVQAGYESEKNRALNSMIAGIAHEIKNPLMSIRAYAGLISQKIDDKEFQESFAEFVPREADRINNLVESLTSYARPGRGIKMQVDLCTIVRECAYLSNVAKRKLPIDVSICAEGSAYIYANPDQIKQLIINMMINGIEAMEEKMQQDAEVQRSFALKVAVEMVGEQVLLTVADNGVGMSETERQQCTNLFYTTKNHGTGMGLALSDQFIRENGGWLEISSKAGEYTRFMVYFPAADGTRACTYEEDAT